MQVLPGVDNLVLVACSVLLVGTSGLAVYLNRVLFRTRLLAPLPPPGEDEVCPICSVERVNLCLTDCSHVFCVPCFEGWYERGQRSTAKCPVCRSSVKRIELRPGAGQRSARFMREYNYYNDDQINLWTRITSALLPGYLLRQARELLAQPRVLFYAVLFKRAILPLAYLLLPLDLLPEATLGFVGLLDDLIIIAIFIGIYYRYQN